jgi:signal peptidase II
MKSSTKPNALIWLLLSVAIIALDQWSKDWVLRTLPEYTPVPVIDGFWNWYRSYNPGAAFSLLADAGGWQAYLFGAFAIGISLLLTVWLARTPRGDWRNALPFSLVIGGALGNLIDRVQHGHVIDFIQWYYGSFKWPSFNVADAAIVGGAIGLILFGVLGPREARESDPEGAEEFAGTSLGRDRETSRETSGSGRDDGSPAGDD